MEADLGPDCDFGKPGNAGFLLGKKPPDWKRRLGTSIVISENPPRRQGLLPMPALGKSFGGEFDPVL